MHGAGAVVGASTMRRYLKKMGLVSRFAPRKPFLTKRHRSLYLKFAKKGSQFWRQVLFTDETRMAIRADSSKLRVRRKTGERHRFITATVVFGLSCCGVHSRHQGLDESDS